MTKTEQSLAQIFAICDHVKESGEPIRTEAESKDLAESFLGLIPVVTQYPCGPPVEPLILHPDFQNDEPLPAPDCSGSIYQNTMTSNPKYTVGDTIRMPHYETMPKGSFRVWKIIGTFLGATAQESVCRLRPLDIRDSTEGDCIIPVIMLETHHLIERV